MLELRIPVERKADPHPNPRPPRSKCSPPGIGMETLPNEILHLIVTSLDAPSAVCLALTSCRLYNCVLTVTKSDRLDDICPKNYYKQSPRTVQIYYFDSEAPHYRDPFKLLDYAKGFGISSATFDPAYTQLMLNLRGWMAPRYVLCFASAKTRYVPRKGDHVCSACQSERRYLAAHELHQYTGKLIRYEEMEVARQGD